MIEKKSVRIKLCNPDFMINRNSKLSPTVNNGRTTSQKKFDLMVFSLIEVDFSGLIYFNFDELLLTLFFANRLISLFVQLCAVLK